ncbi:MAG: amidohydrolase family protein [Candidatus Thorarchaeota archaeon]
METKRIFSKYGFIGENLDFRQNINLEIDDRGIILNISYDEIKKNLEFPPNKHNYLMIPGFINSHVHIGDSFAKEIGFNKDLKEIVAPPFGLKHKLLRNTPEDIIINGIRKSALEMLSNGITLFIDFREGGINGVNLLRKALINSSINYLALGRFMDESEIESLFKIADGVGFSSYKQITSINKKFVLLTKEKYNKIIACHCAENNRNKILIKNIFDDNIVDVIIHGTKFTLSDLEELLENDLSLVLCPRSNGYFGTGFPPINEILKLNIPISLGSDNLMVNNTDLFEEMRFFYRISRVLCKYNKELQVNSKELLKMVTINAARNFNLDSKFGSISKGKIANLFLIDLRCSNLYTASLDPNNIYNIVTQRVRSDNIKKTYIKGETVFERL